MYKDYSSLSCCAVIKFEVLFLTSGTFLWDRGIFLGHSIPLPFFLLIHPNFCPSSCAGSHKPREGQLCAFGEV